MKNIVVLTATYNRPMELKKLYRSLRKQSNMNFSWVLVNDGSSHETVELIAQIKNDAPFEVISIDQENRGKSAAINHGLDVLTSDVDFLVIVDDDEELFSEAIDIIAEYYCKYKNAGCGVIHFNRMNEKGEIIASPCIDEDFYMPYQEFKAQKRHADGYIGYYTRYLGKERFQIHTGEKYVAPSVLYMKVTTYSKLLWAKSVLGKTEYLEGGLTKQGRKLRLKNPYGMLQYCNLMLEYKNLKHRMIYSILGYTYSCFCNEKLDMKNYNFYRWAKIPGKILAFNWERKFKLRHYKSN